METSGASGSGGYQRLTYKYTALQASRGELEVAITVERGLGKISRLSLETPESQPCSKILLEHRVLYVNALLTAHANTCLASPLFRDADLDGFRRGQLVDAGGNVHHEANNKWTPLHCAAAAGDAHACTILLEAGADPDAEVRTVHIVTIC